MGKPKKKVKRVGGHLGAAGVALMKGGVEERSTAASVLGRAGGRASVRRLRKIAADGGRAAWASMSPKERSIEMRRRCQVREANRQARIKAKIEANRLSVAG